MWGWWLRVRLRHFATETLPKAMFEMVELCF